MREAHRTDLESENPLWTTLLGRVEGKERVGFCVHVPLGFQ